MQPETLPGMRWIPWALGLVGVAQYLLMVVLDPSGYVSLDMSYLVMWLAVIGALILCNTGCGCWGGEGGDGCTCCGDQCHCGDCARCSHGGEKGHEGHMH